MKETNNMNLVKNHLPILEFDADNKAVIMPEYSTDFALIFISPIEQ